MVMGIARINEIGPIIRDKFGDVEKDVSRIDDSVKQLGNRYNTLKHREQIHHKKIMSKLDETYDKVNDAYVTSATIELNQNIIMDRMQSDTDDIKELAGVMLRQQDNLLLQANENHADMITHIASLTASVKCLWATVMILFFALFGIIAAFVVNI